MAYLCIAGLSLFPGCRWPISQAKLWFGVSRAGVFTLLGFESAVRWESPVKALSTLSVGKPAHTHSLWVKSRFLQSFYLSQRFSQWWRGTLLHMGPQDWETQSVARPIHSLGWGSTCVDFFFQIPPKGRGPNLMPIFKSYSFMWKSFLQCCLNRSSSVSSQFIFSENCSTCLYIFDVFVGGDELHILIVHHLDLTYVQLIFDKCAKTIQ